jgi:outer membrane protein OmpA-like peptidoglycan-associated protein
MQLTGRWVALAPLVTLALAGCASRGASDVRLEMTREVVVSEPGLTAIELEPAGRLDTRDRGHEIDVTLHGDPGLEASFQVPGRIESAALTETAPGVYSGSFEVQRGEVGDVKVVGTLLHRPSGGRATREADANLTLYASPKEIAAAPTTPTSPTAPAVPPKIDSCESLDTQLRAGPILFEFDDAEIGPQAQAAVDATKRALAGGPPCRVWIFGHTDSIGVPVYNDYLSELRARRVADQLRKAGIPADRIEVRGLGDKHPVITTAGRSAQAPNRRVEVRTTNPYGG